MKSLTKLSIALAPMLGAFVSTQAATALSLGDDISLHVTGQVSLINESNVFLSEGDEISDTAYEYTPGVQLDIGKAGISDLQAQVRAACHILDYVDYSDLDSENADISASLSYRAANVKFSAGATYRESQINSDIDYIDGAYVAYDAARIERATSNYSGYAEITLSQKTRVGGGVSFAKQDYTFIGYNDVSNVSIPLDVYYALSAKTDVTFGYIYRPVYVGEGNAIDAKDNVVTFGLRGQLMPKLTGSARIGWMDRSVEKSSSLQDSDGVFFSASVNYAVSPLTSVGVRLVRDMSVSPLETTSMIRTGASIVANHKLSRVFFTSVNLGFVKTEYETGTRTDDFVKVGASITYAPNEYFDVTASFNCSNNESTGGGREYDNDVLQVIASFNY
jgi:hypothetical protein